MDNKLCTKMIRIQDNKPYCSWLQLMLVSISIRLITEAKIIKREKIGKTKAAPCVQQVCLLTDFQMICPHLVSGSLK